MNSKFIRISNNEGSDDIGNMTDQHRLLVPVIFASMALKYIYQAVYSSTCSLHLYTGYKLNTQKTFRRSLEASYVRSISVLCLGGQGSF